MIIFQPDFIISRAIKTSIMKKKKEISSLIPTLSFVNHKSVHDSNLMWSKWKSGAVLKMIMKRLHALIS